MKKTIEKVWIEPGCISCGACAFLAPDVFQVLTVSEVNPNVDLAHNTDNIVLAARSCPVSVIKYTESEHNRE